MSDSFLPGTIRDNAIIAIFTGFLYYAVGTGILIPDTETNGGGSTGSGSPSVVDFNYFLPFVLLIGLALGSVIFYLIFTKLSGKGIRIIYGTILSIAILFFLFELYIILWSRNPNILKFMVLMTLGAVLPVFTAYFLYIYVTGYPKITIRNMGIITAAVIVGRQFALYFDLLSIVVIAIILSIFDIYSVFKGPLSKIMGKPQRRNNSGASRPSRKILMQQFERVCKRGTPVIMSFNSTILGIGDVLFFSILIYRAMIEWQFLGFFVTSTTIIIGSLGTMLLLQKISPLPGLPIPVLFALIGYATLYLVPFV